MPPDAATADSSIVPAQGNGGGTGDELGAKIREIGADLAAALRRVLDAVPGGPNHRPNDLAATLRLNRQISSRVLSATSKHDPLEAAHFMPGPEPLRRVLRAAAKLKLDTKLIADADDAVRRFEQLIRHDVGGRSALDAMISARLPNARERFELASKHSIFKGMSQIKGVQARTWLGTAIVHPSESNLQRHDLTWLNGAVALQRLRPDVSVKFSYRPVTTTPASVPDEGDVDEVAMEGAMAPPLSVLTLDQFCVNPPVELEVHSAGPVVNYTLPGDFVGLHSLKDMYVVDHHAAAMPRYGKAGPRNMTSLFVEPAIPVQQLVFDVLLHEDAYPGSEPQLFIYDTGYNGIANVKDPSRDIDRVDLKETVEYLGNDISRFYAVEISNYPAMLQHLFEHFGLDRSQFRGYRCRIQYPVYGWQVCLAFRPPMKDA